jgi:hypothetical protein
MLLLTKKNTVEISSRLSYQSTGLSIVTCLCQIPRILLPPCYQMVNQNLQKEEILPSSPRNYDLDGLSRPQQNGTMKNPSYGAMCQTKTPRTWPSAEEGHLPSENQPPTTTCSAKRSHPNASLQFQKCIPYCKFTNFSSIN